MGFRSISNPSSNRFGALLAFGVLIALLGSGCSSVGLGYFLQAGKGQLMLSNRARPIEKVIQDERTPPRTRELLAKIPEIKKWGEAQGLKATGNYVDYVQLDRPAVVWVVSASSPLMFKAAEWSFPIVGSFTYLGWFHPDSAKEHAEELKKTGLDVDVRGARAYSTLGWFKDAVLSSMISSGDDALGELVNTVLHEGVHATLYIKGQSYFNESVASFIGDRMAPAYLKSVLGPNAVELKAYLKSEEESEEKQRLFHQAYVMLDQLYLSARPDAEKLVEKAKILDDLKKKLKTTREINNATLIQYKTYGEGKEEFAALYRACGSNWKRFLNVLLELKPESFSREHIEDLAPVLLPIARDGCRTGAASSRI